MNQSEEKTEACVVPDPVCLLPIVPRSLTTAGELRIPSAPSDPYQPTTSCAQIVISELSLSSSSQEITNSSSLPSPGHDSTPVNRYRVLNAVVEYGPPIS